MWVSFIRRVAFSMLALACGASQADSWVALSGVFNGQSLSGSNSQKYVYGGAIFEDGMYSPQPNTPVLLTPDGVGMDVPYLTISFQEHPTWSTLPPRVDLVQMRADFSSLWLYGWNPEGNPVIGANLGRPGWVPIVANPDGTYVASWQIYPDSFFMGPGSFAMVFSSAVPEASVAAYLIAGLGFVGFACRRRKYF